MKCISRSTLGVIIGVLNVLGYLTAMVHKIIFMVNMNKQFDSQDNISGPSIFNWTFIIYITICSTMIATSGLLIMGIIKRRHKMMIPWLVLSSIGFVMQAISFAYILIVLMSYRVSAGSVTMYILFSFLVFGFLGLIIWLIYTLFKDIKKQNIEKPTQLKYQSA